MEIDEIQEVRHQGAKFQHSHRGVEVHRLAQSVGAEQVARAEALRPKLSQSRDAAEFSPESREERSTGELGLGARPARILGGLLKSFQGHTSDQGSEHRKKSPWFTQAPSGSQLGTT